MGTVKPFGKKGCIQEVRRTLGTPFHDSVLVSHIATDICFYDDKSFRRDADA
jgi:hypothetical protein